MYKEVSIYDKHLSEDQVIDISFKSMEIGISGLNVSSCYVSKLASILPKEIILSSSVDFPAGLSTSKIRQHQTLSLIRRGVNAIDLIVNPVYIVNNKQNALMEDIQAHIELCQNHNIILRLMLEYRHFNDQIHHKIIQICKDKQIKYIFPSTGYFVDDYLDNLIVCKIIQAQYPDVKLITNGNIWEKEHYNTIQKSGIYGLRLKSNYDIRVLSNT